MTESFHVQRIAILVSAGIGMFANFLPWFRAPFIGSMSGASTAVGWLTFLLFVPTVVLALRGDRLASLKGNTRWCAVVPAGIASWIGMEKVWTFHRMMEDVPQDNPFTKALMMGVQIEFGLYVLIAAGLSVVICALALEDVVKSSVS